MPVQTEIPDNNNSGGFPVLPEDFYQVVVKDFYDKDMQKYNAAPGVMETKYLLKLVVLTEGESKGITIVDFVTPSWFNEVGKTNKEGAPITPSKLVNIFKAFYGFYNPKINVFDMSKPSSVMINDLIGKQVRIAVKVKGEVPNEGEEDKRKNKISDYMVIKEELDIPDDIKIAVVGEVKTTKSVVEEPTKEEKDPGFIAGLKADSEAEAAA